VIWLDLASIVIRGRFADIDQRIAAGTLNPALAGHVAVMMVRRVMRARGADDPISESIGEATQTWDRPSDDGDDLFITAAEAGLLAPPTTRGRSRTIALGVGIPGP
jgi:hypothetical protein